VKKIWNFVRIFRQELLTDNLNEKKNHMKKPNLTLMMILLTSVCTVLPSPLTAADRNPGTSIVGSWVRTVTDPNDPNIILSLSFQAYHSDHTEILNSHNPPTSGNTSLGVWTQGMGPRTYKLEHHAWVYNANGDVIGTYRVRDRIAVATSGNTYSGTGELAFCDSNVENCVVLFPSANVDGTRRTVGF
jgi:hypothetical protein